MNYRHYCVYDFETGSKYAETTQPVQIGAVMVHARKLEIIPGSEFESLMKPILDDDLAREKGLDPLEKGAEKVHGKTRDMLKDAPETEAVWGNFVDYVNQYNPKKNSWNAPIPVGYNINNFDKIIVQRLCDSEPYNFGPTKNGKQDVFNNYSSVDMIQSSFTLFENNPEVNSLSADNLIRGYMGYQDKGQAHDALSDVIMTAEYFIRYMRMMRKLVANKKFKGAYSNALS